MKISNKYIAVTIKAENYQTGEKGNKTIVIKQHPAYNLKNIFEKYEVVFATICDSKKQALELAQSWNESFVNNGSCVYDWIAKHAPLVVDC